MNNINKLGLRVVLITAIIFIIIGGIYWGAKKIIAPREEQPDRVAADTATAGIGDVLDTDPIDSDGDGLPDQFESIYRTDKNNPDTDGDGIPDMLEIEEGTDPTIPGPDDVDQPATGEAVIDIETFTDKYLSELPVDITRQEILSADRLEKFVNDNKGQLLPDIPDEQLKTATANDKEAISAYLQKISSKHNDQLKAITNEDIEQALTEELQLKPEAMINIQAQLESNIDILKQVATPAETKELHRQLLATTQALLTNVTILQLIGEDFIGGLIATQNIDELGTAFQEIAKEVARLETKYEL